MIWFFEKDTHGVLHYEIRHSLDGTEYELVITFPDGREEVEQISDSTRLIERSLELQRTLLAEGWRPPRRTRAPAWPFRIGGTA
jgi:hypothetical protein